MTTWLSTFYLGIFGAWLLVTLYDKLCLWWREGKADLKVELLEHDDPQIQHVKPWRRIP
jgi:hypothetical protein